MKKTHKKIFGLFGLVLVVAVTIFAAFLPGPKAQAADITSVKDTIKVKVVGTTPTVDMTGIESGSILTSSEQTIRLEYTNVENLSLKLKLTDDEGVEYEAEDLFGENGLAVNYCPGTAVVNIDLHTGYYSYTYEYYEEYESTPLEDSGDGYLSNYSYGSYVISANGEGWDGGIDEAHTAFTYTPVYGDVSNEKVGDKTINYLNIYYTSIYNGGEVASLKVVVLDANGNEVAFSPILVPAVLTDTNKIVLPFSDYGSADGDYTIKIYAYGAISEDPLAMPYVLKVTYTADKILVPDTGGASTILGDLNISKTDYIITGLIIFSVVGISGAVFIARHDKKTGNGRRR